MLMMSVDPTLIPVFFDYRHCRNMPAQAFHEKFRMELKMLSAPEHKLSLGESMLPSL